MIDPAGDLVAIAAACGLHRDATWRAGGDGAAVAVRVLLRRADLVSDWRESRLVSGTVLISVPAAGLSDPAAGDTVTLTSGGAVYEIVGEPVIDGQRAFWRCEARPL